MWATIGDGHIVRLDPRTLAIEASRRPPRSRGGRGGTDSVEAGLWPWPGLVLAGNVRKLELVPLDAETLAVRSRTRVPSGGRLAQALHDISADARHVFWSAARLLPSIGEG
jgi:hypothetical protein